MHGLEAPPFASLQARTVPAGCPDFFRPARRSAGTDDGGIDAPQVTIDEAVVIEAEQQGIEDLGPGAVLAPAVEAIIDGLPGSVAFRGIGPRGTRVQVPEDAVDQGAMILPRVSPYGEKTGSKDKPLDNRALKPAWSRDFG
jgi:hypothetical protein